MSIILTKDVRIAGSIVAAGPTVRSYAAELEGDLVARGAAIYAAAPSVVDPVTPSREYAAAVVGATLRQRGAPAAVTGTTAATLLCPGAEIPAGMMGINSTLRIESAWSSSPTTNLRTMTIKIGATEGAAVEIWSRARSSASSISEVPLIILQNRGAIDSQVFYTSAGVNYGSNLSSVPETKTIDFSVTQYVYFYGQVASASDNVTLQGYNIAIN